MVTMLTMGDKDEKDLSQVAVRVEFPILVLCREVFLPEAAYNLYSHSTVIYHLESRTTLASFHV